MLGRRSFLAGLAGLASLVTLPRAPRAAPAPERVCACPPSLLTPPAAGRVDMMTARVDLEDGRAVLEHRLGVIPCVQWQLAGAGAAVAYLEHVDAERVVVRAINPTNDEPVRGTVRLALW